MKYLAMVHIGKLDCVAMHNLEAIFYSTFHFTNLQEEKYFTMQMKPTNLKPLAPTTTFGHTP